MNTLGERVNNSLMVSIVLPESKSNQLLFMPFESKPTQTVVNSIYFSITAEIRGRKEKHPCGIACNTRYVLLCCGKMEVTGDSYGTAVFLRSKL